MSRFSWTVRWGKIRRPSGTWEIPRATISWGWRPRRDSPRKRISPPRGGTMPQTDMRVVDFPAPLAPMRVMISPSPTVRDTSRRAWMLP